MDSWSESVAKPLGRGTIYEKRKKKPSRKCLRSVWECVLIASDLHIVSKSINYSNMLNTIVVFFFFLFSFNDNTIVVLPQTISILIAL